MEENPNNNMNFTNSTQESQVDNINVSSNVQEQPVKKKKNVGLIVGIVIAVIIIVSIIVGVIILTGAALFSFNKSAKKEISKGKATIQSVTTNTSNATNETNTTNTTNETNTTNNTTTTTREDSIKKDVSKPWVYDAEYGKDKQVKKKDATNVGYKKLDSSKDLVAPFINIDSEAADSINYQIKKYYNNAYDHFVYNDNGESFECTGMEYRFFENKNILSIVLLHSAYVVPGGGNTYIEAYNFNLATGEEATLEDMVKVAGLSVDECNDRIKSFNEKMYESKEYPYEGLKGSAYLNKNGEFVVIFATEAAGTHDDVYNINKQKEEPNFYGEAASTETETKSKKEYTQQELEKMALDYYEKKNNYRPSNVASTKNSDGTISIQLYDSLSDHNSTADWYTIDPKTATGTNILGNKIDLKDVK